MNVAIIPARGGSRRIQGKNIKDFRGRPIILYSIETALLSGMFASVVVSTDDDAIAEVAQKRGAAIHRRPPKYCDDAVGTQQVMRKVLVDIQAERCALYDYACCIYATAPLMLPSDITDMYHALIQKRVPYSYIEGWLYWGRAEQFISRPDLGDSFFSLKPVNRWIDINTKEDWKRAEDMYATYA